jgi:hypothetical protein
MGEEYHPVTMSSLRSSLILSCLLVVCLLAGCTGSQNPTGAQTTVPAGGTMPGLVITSPADGAVLPAGDIIVSVQVRNFRLVPSYGRPYVAGEGHLHYSMSMGVPASGSSSVVAPISYVATTATSYTWPDVPAGTYTFTVELENNDHSPFPTPIRKSVTVGVTGTLPATTAVTASGGGTDIRSCTTDADCVPEQCCHPTSCINRAYRGVCNELCTEVCLGPLDCGAGHCGCSSGSCSVAPGKASSNS